MENDARKLCLGRAGQGHASSCRAAAQISATSSPAGTALVSEADWPAQACIRWTSPSFWAALRIRVVSPRWTGQEREEPHGPGLRVLHPEAPPVTSGLGALGGGAAGRESSC